MLIKLSNTIERWARCAIRKKVRKLSEKKKITNCVENEEEDIQKVISD